MKLFLKLISDNRVYACMNLYPGKTGEEVREILAESLEKRMKKAVPLAAAVAALFITAGMLNRDEKDSRLIQRADVNGASFELPLILKNGYGENRVSVKINPREMSDEEIDAMEAQVEKVLDSEILNGNGSFSKVGKDLNFPEFLDDLPVLLSWSTGDPRLVDLKGRVNNRELKENRDLMISAKVYYGAEFRLYERQITVIPYEFTDEEAEKVKSLEQLRELEKNHAFDDSFLIPYEVGGTKVIVPEKEKVPYAFSGILLGMCIGCAAWSNFFSSLKEKKKKRMDQAETDYKEFVSKLSILLAAGMSLRPAWRKLAEDFSESRGENMLSENLTVTYRELMNGRVETVAYERFGERMELPRYRRIASILSQTVTKGVSELTEILASELKEAVAEEREKIKIRGEQAGTKLLMPMMGFMVIVFAILLMPAFSTF